MTNLKIILHDEVQLIDWGESRATGPWVKLRLADIEHLEAFRGLDTATAKRTGHIFNLTLSQGDILDAPTPPENSSGPITTGSFPGKIPTPYGSQAKELRLSDFFRRPEVWRAVGSDADFQSWVRQEPCIVCGDRDFDPDTGTGQTEFAHVRRAGEAGTGYKPEYSGVSLCHSDHAGQHKHGETRMYRSHLFRKHGYEQQITIDQAKDWFDKKRIEAVQAWCWDYLKEQLGYDSWSMVPPIDLFDWAFEKDVFRLLPECYRGTVISSRRLV